MRELKWIGSILLFISIIFGTTIIYQSFNKESKAFNSKQPMNSSAIINQQFKSEFPGLHLRTETEDTSKYTMSISIPSSEHDAINKPIKKWIREQKRRFLLEVNEYDDTLIGGDIAHLNIQLKSKKIKNDMYSLVFTSEKYINGTDDKVDIQPFIISMKENKIMSLNDFFNTSDEFSEQLYILIKEQISHNQELGYLVSDDFLKESVSDLEQLKWIFSKKHFIIYFGASITDSGKVDLLSFKIPLEKLNDFLIEKIVKKEEEKLPNIEKPKVEENEEDINEEANDDIDEDIQENDEKEKPEGNAKLESTTGTKYVALTFDDGPSSITPRILQSLKKYNAKATFFMLGIQVDYYKSIAKQVVDEGHEIANHSNSHPDLTKLGYSGIEQQLTATHNKIEQATGVRSTLIRPPYGAFNKNVITYANKHQNQIVLWSVDTQDWKSRNGNTVYNTVMQNVTDGSIILMHDIYPSTADALPAILKTLSEQGYKFVTVSELLSMQDKSGAGPHSGMRKTK